LAAFANHPFSEYERTVRKASETVGLSACGALPSSILREYFHTRVPLRKEAFGERRCSVELMLQITSALEEGKIEKAFGLIALSLHFFEAMSRPGEHPESAWISLQASGIEYPARTNYKQEEHQGTLTGQAVGLSDPEAFVVASKYVTGLQQALKGRMRLAKDLGPSRE
jgi:hypothetical protein